MARINRLLLGSEGNDQELVRYNENFEQVEQEMKTMKEGFATLRQNVQNARSKRANSRLEKVGAMRVGV